jgi:hypothetical protein
MAAPAGADYGRDYGVLLETTPTMNRPSRQHRCGFSRTETEL